ncbi:Required for meiotic nuclear division protein 1 -like protein [Escovopsis weberi]|uniref:Required for meiotic nuclear division protein 1-like protein n=1 Tax=Escovopsis weberi TaxID=150374 RepID=A0A0M8MW70_ESCWE|nr:Required for meiotic nuclear division protein 1 -like protein [Escovopsis weberi]
MRNTLLRTTNAAAHSIHGSVIPPRLRRSFHITASARQPRRRTFFTSNPYLSSRPDSQDAKPGSEGEEQTPGPDEPQGRDSTGATPPPPAPPSPAAVGKRKPTRVASTKNSLRRVAIIAQQPKRGGDDHGGERGGGGGGGGGGGIVSDRKDGRPAAYATATAEAGADRTANLVSATCIAEAFDMPSVLEILSSHGFAIDPDGTSFDDGEVVHARGVNGGDIFVFPSGTIVTWALPPDVVTRQILRAAEDPHPAHLREAEDLEFVTDNTRETSALRGELVVLGTRKEHRDGDTLDTTLAKIAFSSGLARSTKLAVLEGSLTSYFESTRGVPALLSRGAGVPLGRRFILQKTGELLSLRARLNHYSELTDNLPDIFWDSRSELGLEGYYDQVGRALDVNVRIRALNQKMDYAQEIASVLREMSSEQHGTRLEWIIILLIFVEVVFELRRIVMEHNAEQKELAKT